MRPVHYFIRHGQTKWNVERRFQGREEVELDATGRAQALRNGGKLAELLAHPGETDFVSSPQLRACRTMAIIRQRLGLAAAGYSTDARLVEIDYGDWQGLTEPEVRERFPELYAERMRNKWNFVPPGPSPESYAMQARRFAPFLADLNRSTVCVAHGGILRCVLVLAAGWPTERAGRFEVPQDRILRLEQNRVEWL